MSSLIRYHLGRRRPSVAKSSKPSKPFLPTSHSPQEGYLKDCEDRLSSTEELRGNVVDYSKRNEDNHGQCQFSQRDLVSGRDTQREELFQHFYRVLQRAWDRERPSDCVIISMDTNQRDYTTAIGRRLRDRGLVVETIHLASESDLTRALQDVKDDGSPFCILVEQSDVKCSSCTVIMLHASIKIHRHMPLEDVLVLVAEELKRFFIGQSTGISQRATQLVDDFLTREHLTSHSVPSSICHLLFLLSEGKHLYREELGLLMDYLTVRKEQLQGCEAPDSSSSSIPAPFQGKITPIVSKPPPLLPALGPRRLLGAPPPRSIKPLVGDRQEVGLLPAPGYRHLSCQRPGSKHSDIWGSTEGLPFNSDKMGSIKAPHKPSLPTSTSLGNSDHTGAMLSSTQGLVNPKGLFPTPLLQVGPSKRPAPLGYSPAVPVKKLLLVEKPSIVSPAPVLLKSVSPKWALKPKSLRN